MAKKNFKDSPIDEKVPTETADLGKAETAKSLKGSTTEDTLVKKDVLPEGFSTTTRVSTIVTDPIGISGVSGPFSSGSYGGTRLDGAGSAQALPSQGKSARSKTREGKKLDSTVKKINSIVSEQVEVSYKESKPINETSDPQGYSGRYTDAHLRVSKINGAHPGDLLFDRSLDEITRDELNFIEGQYMSTSDNLDDHVTGKYRKGTSSEKGAVKVTTENIKELAHTKHDKKYYDVDGAEIDVNDYVIPLYQKGNYVVRSLTISLDENDKVLLTVTEDDITPDANIDTINRASQSALTFANRTELDRQIMETKAGNENSDNWTPLALAVEQPTRINGMLRSLEADTGSTVFAGVTKAQLAHSYQINKAHKDGQRHSTIGEMLTTGDIFKCSGDAPDKNNIFKNDAYAKGCASLFINMYDSTPKYNNRADVLTQPRSLKLHINTALHYAAQLKVYEQFARHFKHSEAFSYLGDGYDPFLPICITDAETEVHSFRWSDFIDPYGLPRPLVYSYGNVRNNLTQLVYHPLIAGIYDWATDFAPKIKAMGGTITFNVVHGTKFISGWDILMCVVTPYVVKNRVQSFHDVIDYETRNGYPYSGFITMKEALDLPFKNFSFISIEEPLTVGKMNSAQALTWILPEIPMYMGKWDPTTGADTLFHYLMPWYMSVKSFDYEVGGSGFLSKGVSLSDTPSMSMPSIRSGVSLNFLNKLYEVSERDIRLTYDMMVELPAMRRIKAKGAFFGYKYGRSADAIPVIGYHQRLTIGALLKTPRELGFQIVVPGDYLRLTPSSPLSETLSLDSYWLGDTSYCAYVWHANSRVADEILSEANQMTQRASALQQIWRAYAATKADVGAAQGSDPLLGLNSLFNINGTLKTKFSLVPFTDIDDSELTGTASVELIGKGYGFISIANAVWFMIQRLPMLISPWDFVIHQNTSQNSTKGNVDPFEMLYWFGLAGFRASDYSEDITNRIHKRSVEGITYTEDLFVQDCPVLK